MARSTARPTRTRLTVALSALACAGAATMAGPAGAHAPVSTTTASTAAAAAPSVSLVRTIKTTPFARTRVSMKDNEGSAYVHRDRTLWLADDRNDRLYAVNPRNGRLKRTIGQEVLARARKFGGGRRAGIARTRDLESLAYDAARDRLYAFTGTDCTPSRRNCQVRSRPAVFRFDRRNGRLQLHSYQPLRRGRDHTAAGWNPVSKNLFVGRANTVRRYVYTSNRYGSRTVFPDITDILGLDFTGNRLLIAHNNTRVTKVDWRTKATVWSVGLRRLGVRDARGVEEIGRRLFIADGYDHRPAGNRRQYAVFVVKVGG